MRLERHKFLEGMAQNRPTFPRLIYTSGSDRRSDGGRLDFISVIFNLNWPSDMESKGPVLESLPKTAVAAAIFRVKDYLERRIFRNVRLLDVRAGCVQVRYALPDEIKPYVVEAALISLNEERAFFSVVSVSANVQGRAIKI